MITTAPNSLIERAYTSTAPVSTPRSPRGRVTRRNACHGLDQAAAAEGAAGQQVGQRHPEQRRDPGGDRRSLRVGTSQIDSFTVGSGGRLTAAPGSPFPAQGLGPFGSEFRPTRPDQLFVSNAHNGGISGTVSAFRNSANGTLSSIGSSPLADLQTAPCWVEISPNGQFLFTVNTGSGTISRYSIAPGGALRLLGSTPVGAVDAASAPAAAPCSSTRAGSVPSARSPSTAAT